MSSRGEHHTVPLSVLLKRELANEKVDNPEIQHGQASQSKKGEDFTLLKTECQRARGDGVATFSVFGLFDGHNGSAAAIYTKENLLNNVLSALPSDLNRDEWVAALPRALVAGFVKTDKDFQERARTSGTTVTFVIIEGWVVTVASVGDSRCILEPAEGGIYYLSADHRLECNEEERQRVTASGGEVGRLNTGGGTEIGPLRCWPGGLCLSRSIGDMDVGEFIVPVPYVKQVKLSTAGGRLIISSDGVWDNLTAETALDCCRGMSAEAAAAQIVKEALQAKGLRDDTTCIVVDILPQEKPPAPLPPSKKQGKGMFKSMFRKNAIEGSENDILCNLFPDDMGVELPHQSAKLLVGDGPAFDENRVSRPYKWAQHLAGIDFLPELPPLFTGQEPSTESAKSDTVVSGLQLYRQQNRVQTVVQRIRSRKRAQLALVEQLDLLTKLKWPALDSESVPWALHTPLCSLYEWSAIGPLCNQISSLPVNSIEQSQEPVDVGMDGRSGPSREEAEGAREDGELPSLVSFASSANDIKLNPNKGPNLEHSRQLTLISKSIISPLGKSQSFKKYDDSDLMLDIDCDLDEPAPSEVEIENAGSGEFHERADNSWMDYGVREYYLTLSRKMDAKEKDVKLKAKIKISREYPLRPPLLALSLHACSEEDYDDSNNSGGYNELRSMEAEVNLHMLKMVSVDQENYILSHQLRCLAMLFDYYMDDGSPSSEVKKSSSVIDVGLCKPVSGKLLARSFRGRDRRRMISWKDTECASGFPC